MKNFMQKISKTTSIFVLVFFSVNMLLMPVSYAQVSFLPPVGTMVNLTPKFDPLLIKGVKLFPDNPFKFEFIVDTGDKPISQEQVKEEGQKLVSYFLAALTTPEKEMWVNLSPYEKSRIIPQGFGDTEMGKELLAQDYLLKQIMATALYPERQMGKEFWNKVYSEAAKKFGTTNVPVNTFNKVWILPNEAVVYENTQMNAVFVVQSSLKVMLEQDYLAANKNKAVEQFNMDEAQLAQSSKDNAAVSAMSASIVKEIVIPALEREVNEGANFAKLRQVYQGLILAAWYKKNLKDNVIAKGYVDQGKTKGVDTQDKEINQKIYQQYLKAYKKGAYNYIKEDADPVTNQIVPRKYFSGGVIGNVTPAMTTASPAMAAKFDKELTDSAMRSRLFTLGATALLIGAGLLFSSGNAQAASVQELAKQQGNRILTSLVGSKEFRALGPSIQVANNTPEAIRSAINDAVRTPGAIGLPTAKVLADANTVYTGPDGKLYLLLKGNAPTGAGAVVPAVAVPASPVVAAPAPVAPPVAATPAPAVVPSPVAIATPTAPQPAAALPNVPGQITARTTPDGRVAGAIIPAVNPTDRFSEKTMGFYNNPYKLSIEIRKSEVFTEFLKAVGDREFAKANLLAAKLSNPEAQVTAQNIPGYGGATVIARNQGIVESLRPIGSIDPRTRANPLQTAPIPIVMGNLTGSMPRGNPINFDILPNGYGFVKNTNDTWTFISDPSKVNVSADSRFNITGKTEMAEELKKHISFEGENQTSARDRELIIGKIVERIIASWKAGNAFELRGYFDFESKRRIPAAGFSQAAFGSATIPVHGFETITTRYSVNYSINDALVLGHQVSPAKLATNRAQLANEPDSVGGIDLEKVNVMIKNGTSGIKTAFADPRILELMRNSQGLFAQIESVIPMTPPMVNMYLGFNSSNVPVQSADQKPVTSFPKAAWVIKEIDSINV